MGIFAGVELDDVELRGERLLLRRWHADDAAAVHAIMQDDAMFTYLPLPRPYTLAEATAFVTGTGDEGRAEGRGLGCAMVAADSGELVGSAAVRLDRDGEIGYWVGSHVQRRGYATEATRLLRDFAFDLGLPRLHLLCDTRNLASVKVAQRAGFRFEGITRGPQLDPQDPSAPQRGDLARFAILAGDPRDPIRPAFPPLPGGMLADGEVGLRPMTPDDAAALLKIEDEVAAGWGFTDTPSTLEQLRRTAAEAGLQWQVGGQARMVMIDLASGAVAGEIALRGGGPPQLGAIGYGVHPRFRGRAFTTKALRLLTAWAFDVGGYARLELGAKRANIASQRAAERAGFVREGVFASRLRNPDGTFSDEVCFGLVNPEHR